MERPYLYRPLATKDAIRLLKVHSTTAEGQLEVSLTTFPLSDPALCFNALSYTWSNPLPPRHPYYTPYDNKTCLVLCEGRTIQVKENLMDALLVLTRDKELAELPIWIDAICINQTDVDERTHQIKLMAEIYSKASRTVLWLGRPDPTTDRAIQLATESSAHHFAYVKETIVKKGRCSWAVRLDDKHLPGDLDAIRNFLQRNWFTRSWTLQEVLLPAVTTALCGPRRFHIGDFFSLAAVMLLSTQGPLTAGPRGWTGNSLSKKQLLTISSMAAWTGCTWSGGGFGERAFFRYPTVDYKRTIPDEYKWLVALELLVNDTRQRDCSEEKDKIFAPLSFALKFVTKNEMKHKEALEKILDYRLSIEELYCRFTRFLISAMGGLDILSRAGCKRDSSTTKLPSWVPAFHTPGVSSLIDELLWTKFDAAEHLGAFKYLDSAVIDSQELRLEAVFLGGVWHVSEYSAPSASVPSLTDFLDHVSRSPKTRIRQSWTPMPDIAQIFAQSPELTKRRQSEKKFMEDRSGWMEFYLSTIGTFTLNTPSVDMPQKRMFAWTLGEVGLGPALMVEGDQVCILRGARVPFIVRPTPKVNVFELVGEAYLGVHMYGKLADSHQKTEQIVLV